MELKQLEYFMVLCRELHFTRAAEKLGIAQPSLSQQIRLLEHEIGTPLFDRVGKRTVLTEAGKTLLHHGYNVFHELSQARAAISELIGLQRGTLKIGALLTVVNYLLPPAVIEFHRRYPSVELSILGLRTGISTKGCCATNSIWASSTCRWNTTTWKRSRCMKKIWRLRRPSAIPWQRNLLSGLTC